jgi:DnaJ-class molecular chaperone
MRDLNIHLYKKITLEQALCGGNFVIQLNEGRLVKVQLKPGISDGQKIRLKSFGLASADGMQKGDALITLNVLDHPFFKVAGLDINSIFVVSPAEAMSGTVKQIQGPDGKKIAVRIAPNSKNGDVVTVKGAGLKRNDEAGDIHFQIQIEELEELNEFFKTSLLNQKGELPN